MAQQKQAGLILSDGEKLLILIRRDGRKVEDLAPVWGVTRQQLSRYTKEERLNPKVLKRACEVLGVSDSVFDPRLDVDRLLEELDRLSALVDSLNQRVHVLEAEKSGLADAIKIMTAGDPPKEKNN